MPNRCTAHPVNVKAVAENGHVQVFIWSDKNAVEMETAILQQQEELPELWMSSGAFFPLMDAVSHSSRHGRRYEQA